MKERARDPLGLRRRIVERPLTAVAVAASSGFFLAGIFSGPPTAGGRTEESEETTRAGMAAILAFAFRRLLFRIAKAGVRALFT